MKRTEALNIMVDSSFPLGKIVIHPNDGFDLGLMQTHYTARVFMNIRLSDFKEECGDPVQGQIFLENTCRRGYAELSQKCWERMKKPNSVLLVYDSNKVLLLSAS